MKKLFLFLSVAFITTSYAQLGIATYSFTPTSSLHVIGTGTTSSTYVFKAQDNSSNLNFSIRDDGQVNSRLGYSLNNNLFVHQKNNDNNTFVGQAVGLSATGAGLNNTGLGYTALTNLTTGFYNTAIGSQALAVCTTGYGNTAIGFYTLPLLYGSSNTAIGSEAFSTLASGGFNVAIGAKAGRNYTGGSYNVIVGDLAEASSSGSYNSTLLLGAGALSTGSNQGVIGSASTALNNIYFGRGVNYANTLYGFSLAFQPTSVAAGQTNAQGMNWFFNGSQGTGTGAGGDITFKVAPAGSSGSSVNSLVTCLTLKSTGNVGIGTASPGHLLELSADDAAKPSTSTWSVVSDIRLKKDTSAFTDGLNIVKNIRPINFKYNGLARTPSNDKPCIGISAQQMQAIAPYTVKVSKKELSGTEADEFPYTKTYLRTDTVNEQPVPVYEADILTYNPDALFYLLVNSVKELANENAILRQRIEALEQR